MRLTKVFQIHRFVAGGFGLSLLFAPQLVNDALDASGRRLPLPERTTLQSWACFMIAVAGIVHAARSFPLTSQRSIGVSLLVCFILLDGLYCRILMIDDNEEANDEWEKGVAATGAVFFGLTLAYAWALAEKPSTDNGKHE